MWEKIRKRDIASIFTRKQEEKGCSRTRDLGYLLLFASIMLLTVRLYFSWMGFDVFVSDVEEYWRDSLRYAEPFNPGHVPGYPLLLAAIRAMTFGSVSPIVILSGVSFLAFFLSVWGVYVCITLSGSRKMAFLGTLVFTVWPAVGVVYAAFPMSDSAAIALLVWGICFMKSGRPFFGAVLLGVSAITHKAMWLFAAACLPVLIYREAPVKLFKLAFIALAPFLLLWGSGTLHHGTVTWIFSETLKVNLSSRAGLPVLDGLFGPVLEGGWPKIAKAVLLVSAVVLAGILLLRVHRIVDRQLRMLSRSILLAFLVLAVLVNSLTAMSAIRFSKLLVVPLFLYLGEEATGIEERPGFTNKLTSGILILLTITQYLYAYYLVSFFETWLPK
jgi:hypothetical protein